MISGKSPEHVVQDIGKNFSVTCVKGYYNDFTQKVIIEPGWLKTNEIISVKQADGTCVVFPVAVFQYALGCFDLYLSTHKEQYRNKFLRYADWTLDNQDSYGRWNNFGHIYPENPYGAMAQGEAASVLIRAHELTNNQKYIYAAKKSIDFMLKPISEGGTSLYTENDLLFKEYCHLPVVLNGWIFSWWGLYDYVIATNDKKIYFQKLNRSLETIIKYLPRFEYSFWSRYDLSSKITSPFYHRLHIAQMQAMYKLTGENIFMDYAHKWQEQAKNPFNKSLAFVIKSIQKIIE